jgi:hypothetical protein
MLTLDALLGMRRSELHEVLRGGHPIDPASLDDTEYRGTSLGLPAFVERLTWKTFKKVFHRDPETGHLRGWNVRLEQRGIDGPSVPMQRRGAMFTFGHYRVVSMEGRRTPAACGPGLLIDYGLGENGRLDPMRSVRDPIVAVNAGQRELLLGWSYLDLGAIQVGTPSFFALSYEGPLAHSVRPPGRA